MANKYYNNHIKLLQTQKLMVTHLNPMLVLRRYGVKQHQLTVVRYVHETKE